MISLCALKDFDLRNDGNQNAILDAGGLEVLLNLLDTKDSKCKVGATSVHKNFILVTVFVQDRV